VDPRLKKGLSNDDLAEQLAFAEEALQAREFSFQLIVDSIP
jgi:hypothetical protein